MPAGSTPRYIFNTLGRMTSRHHPDADAATLYKYDDLGRQRFMQDARQRAAGTGATEKVTYTVYDEFGRVTRVGEAAADFSRLDPERSYPFESDASSWRSRKTYDGGEAAGGEATGGGPNYAQGRLTRAQENTDADAAAEVVHRYAYDHLGNVRVKQVVIEGLTGAKTATYTHDLAGRVTRLTYPDGAQARYAYDSAGRLSRVGDANGNTLAAYTHTAAGNIETHVAGDDIVTGRYAYNAREWVTDLNYAGTFRSKLAYDLAGNVTRQEYSHNGAASKTADYAYDDLYRITGFDLTGGTSRDYAYEQSGNLKSMVTGSSRLTYNYSAGSTPNRLDSTAVAGATTTYAYNQNGWMTARGTDTVTYDYRGLTTGVGSATYLMDPDRRRVKKTVGTAVTYYLRGPGGNVLAEYSGQTLSARYVYAGSRRIARIAGDSASYYLADHLGSTRSLVGEDGAVTAAYDYWPYGKNLATSGTGATHFRFTGHERDAESGLDYMLNRNYAFAIGRFLRPDPMQDARPWISPYSYAQNNPVIRVDPTGLLDWVQRSDGTIEWDEKVTSAEDADLGEGETYLGRNVIVATHNRDENLVEPINTARFDLYLDSNKKGPSATIMGNTVPADVERYGTMAEGLYTASFQSRYSKGNDDLAIIINGGREVPTVRGNPNKLNSDFLTGVFLHQGNTNRLSLTGRDSHGRPVNISEGCLTTICGKGSQPKHKRFMLNVGRDFNGYLYLRAKP